MLGRKPTPLAFVHGHIRCFEMPRIKLGVEQGCGRAVAHHLAFDCRQFLGIYGKFNGEVLISLRRWGDELGKSQRSQ